MKQFLCGCHKLSILEGLTASVVIVYFNVSSLKAGPNTW